MKHLRTLFAALLLTAAAASAQGSPCLTVGDTLTFAVDTSSAPRTVTFNARGGLPVPAQQTVAHGGLAAAPTPAPARTGYTFGGWYADTSKWSAAGWNFNAPVTGNITLYAKWIAGSVTTYTVTFAHRNGNPATTSVVEKDSVAHCPVPNPTRTGYTFVGWIVDTVQNTAWNFSTSTVTRDTTLYALWTKEGTSMFTVTLNERNGKPLTSRFIAAGDTVPRPANPVRAGYGFVNWVTDTVNNAAWSFSATVTINGVVYTLATSKVTRDTTLYALWSKENVPVYTVVFDACGGSVVPLCHVTSGDTVARPANPARTGSTFEGWYADSVSWSAAWSFSTPITSDTTLFAKWKRKPFTVTFNARGGTPALTQDTVAYGDTVPRPEDPTRTGYDFNGWYTNLSGWDDDNPLLPVQVALSAFRWSFGTSTLTRDTTLLAMWSVRQYTVAFDARGGEPAPPAQAVKYGSAAAAPTPAPARTGYKFGGWYADTANSWSNPAWNFNTNVISGDTTLFAKWIHDTISVYTVTFVYRNGNPITTSVVEKDSTVHRPAPDPTRTGSTFEGWYADSVSWGAAWSFSTPVTSDTTLFAKWTVKRYRVTFNAYGGTPALTQDSVAHGDTIPRPANPTRTGYSFGGWYADTSSWSAEGWNFTTPITGDTTLFAKWTSEEYTVTFNALGGSYTPDQQAVLYRSFAAEPNPAPVKSGYNFSGWYADTSSYWQGDHWRFTADRVTADTTLYARWIDTSIVTDTVTFVYRNGEEDLKKVVFRDSLVREPNTPARTGYTFGGWYADSVSWYPAWDFNTPITANATLYAKWTLIRYRVTFNAYGGSFSGEPAKLDSVPHGSTVPRPEDPEREGCTFNSWVVDTAANTAWDFVIDVVTSDTTLYAQWTQDSVPPIDSVPTYTVTFDAMGGTPAFTYQDVRRGSRVARPANPTLRGYDFDSWYADFTLSTPWNFAVDSVMSDITLYAGWVVLTDFFITVITPNGDGINDYLEVPETLLLFSNELTVFNRTGNMVYDKKGYDNTFNGAGLPDGTYYYFFTYTDHEDKVHRIVNSVWITRSW